ncbi:hypothetical protein DL98DRAFT_214020 [Cadophora sp. DSE1049]|nr:hypothetical protein DL98DRAFT_214020 [Cadophora sp. DSE1049]
MTSDLLFSWKKMSLIACFKKLLGSLLSLSMAYRPSSLSLSETEQSELQISKRIRYSSSRVAISSHEDASSVTLPPFPICLANSMQAFRLRKHMLYISAILVVVAGSSMR